MSARILVIGAEGQLARALREARAPAGLSVTCAGRPDLDLEAPDAARARILALRPDAVINAAAYTAVDRAESEPDRALAINRDGARAAAEAAAALGAPFVHVSTDYVFDGALARPYRERDPTGPTGVYGRSKLEGEQAVADACPEAVILRTAWVYAPYGANFVRTMIRLAGERERIGVVHDQVGCPTYAPDLADAALSVVSRLLKDGQGGARAGVFHAAGPDALSWRAFAEAVMRGLAERGAPAAAIDPIPTSAYPTPARRPANSRLDCERLAEAFGLRLPPLATSLSACLDALVGPVPLPDGARRA